MNRFLTGSCLVFFAFVLGASAQSDFKGFYVGGYAGGASGNSNAQTTTVFSPTGYFASTSVPAIAAAGAQNLSSTGFTGGGTAGYNYQHNSFVLGFEFDMGALRVSDSKSTTAPYPCCPTTGFTVTQSVKTDWLLTLRPRVGFVARRVMFYGTGGLAVANLNYQALFTDTFATAHENGGVDGTKTGWGAGGGGEFDLGHHWSMKGEYLYVNLGSVTTTSTNLRAPAATAWPTNVFTHTADFHSHTGRVGFNFRF